MDGYDKLLEIAAALNGKEVFTSGSVLVRATAPSDGRYIFAAVANEDLVVSTKEARNATQFWAGKFLVCPMRRFRDDEGTLMGLRVGQTLSSKVDLRLMTEIPTDAPRSILADPESTSYDKISQIISAESVVATGTLAVRRVNRRLDDNDCTLLAGALNVRQSPLSSSEQHMPDEVWLSRLVLMPAERWQDLEGETMGMGIDDVLCSRLDPRTLHRLD